MYCCFVFLKLIVCFIQEFLSGNNAPLVGTITNLT